jgi:phage FluMu protein Com
VAKFSEDVLVRCYSCGRVMGTNTVRSEDEQDYTKMLFMNRERIRCRKCDKANESAVRAHRSPN